MITATQAIVQSSYSKIVKSNLVLWYDAMNDNSYPETGTIWTNLASTTNNGAFFNGPTYDSANGGSIVLDGVDDFVSSSYSTAAITNVTMQCWVNITSTSRKGTFTRVGSGSNGYSIGVGSGNTATLGNELIGLFPGIRWIATGTSMGTGWKMVTMTLNASSVPSIYLNSSLVNSYSGTNPTAPTAGFYIGRNAGDEAEGPRAFGGNVAVVLFYTKQLTATEILQNYNAVKPRFGL